MGIGLKDMCPCDTAPVTTEHLLQHCPLQDALRCTTWPDETPLKEMFYGDLAALKRTAAFVRATGVDV